MRVTRAPVMSRSACRSGSAQRASSDCMPGLATQCASRRGRPLAVTRPAASSICTALALQRLHRPGSMSTAWAKRGSRTVKYWAPAAKLPNGGSMVAGEVVGGGVEAAKGGVDGGGAAAGLGGFLEHRDLVPGLRQRARAGDACHARADDGEMARGWAGRIGKWGGGVSAGVLRGSRGAGGEMLMEGLSVPGGNGKPGYGHSTARQRPGAREWRRLSITATPVF